MYRLTSKLIIYSNIGADSILMRLSDITRRFYEKKYQKEGLIREILDEIHRLLDISTFYGFDKNLWHNYLAFLLATTETPFTLVSEKVGTNEGSVNTFAENDFAIFKALFDYDFSEIEMALGINCFSVIENFSAVPKKDRIYNKSVSEKVRSLSCQIEEAENANEVFKAVTDFYGSYGVGKFGLNKAFRLADDNEHLLTRGYAGSYTEGNMDSGLLVPITNTSEVTLDTLVGYEEQKRQLIDNTEAFIEGRAANNVLLYGEAGTGKSTSIKAILNMYYDRGLRMIEIYKHQFKDLSKVMAEIKNRNYRFIIYMDDLSFEESELEYKYLKAIIEGGLEPRPDNVLIYATSNRRHLVRESFKDRADADTDDIHRNDTIQEKLSLSKRFGIQIGFFRPNPEQYKEIVRVLAKRHPEIKISDEELMAEAGRWELSHGGISGRAAQQFVDYLSGKK